MKKMILSAVMLVFAASGRARAGGCRKSYGNITSG